MNEEYTKPGTFLLEKNALFCKFLRGVDPVLSGTKCDDNVLGIIGQNEPSKLNFPLSCWMPPQ
jgi:hypothetical protein